MNTLLDIRVAVNGNGPHGLKGRRGRVRDLLDNKFRVTLDSGDEVWLLPTQLDFFWNHWTTRWLKYPPQPRLQGNPDETQTLPRLQLQEVWR